MRAGRDTKCLSVNKHTDQSNPNPKSEGVFDDAEGDDERRH